MRAHRFPHLAAPIALAIALLGALGQPDTANAAERTTRLTLSVDLVRDAGTRLGADLGRMHSTQHVDLTLTLVGDGVPAVGNALDPDDQARQFARSQRTLQRVRDAQARVAARRAGQAPLPAQAQAPAQPQAADLQALQARAQQLQAKCGRDTACLMREAAQISALQMASRGVPGAVTPTLDKNAVLDDAADETPPTPYLLFNATADCRASGSLRIDERIEGTFADVQGPVHFVHTRQADDATAGALACGSQRVVLDTRDGRLWTDNALLGVQGRGVSVRSEQNRPSQRSEGPQRIEWYEAGAWLAARLQNLSRQGSAETTLPAGPDGRADGQMHVRLVWRWQDV